MVTSATSGHLQKASSLSAAVFLRAGRKQPGTDLALFQCALDFANEKPGAERFVPWSSERRDLAYLDEWRRADGTTRREMMPSYGPLATERRTELRECLTKYLEAASSIRARFAKELDGRVFHTKVKVRVGPSGKVSRTHETWPLSWPDLLAYLMLLLLDESTGLGAALCRCRLESCQKFFLVKKPPTGRPRRDYHTDKCMLEAHARQSTVRARKSRAKRRPQ